MLTFYEQKYGGQKWSLFRHNDIMRTGNCRVICKLSVHSYGNRKWERILFIINISLHKVLSKMFHKWNCLLLLFFFKSNNLCVFVRFHLHIIYFMSLITSDTKLLYVNIAWKLTTVNWQLEYSQDIFYDRRSRNKKLDMVKIYSWI